MVFVLIIFKRLFRTTGYLSKISAAAGNIVPLCKFSDSHRASLPNFRYLCSVTKVVADILKEAFGFVPCKMNLDNSLHNRNRLRRSPRLEYMYPYIYSHGCEPFFFVRYAGSRGPILQDGVKLAHTFLFYALYSNTLLPLEPIGGVYNYIMSLQEELLKVIDNATWANEKDKALAESVVCKLVDGLGFSALKPDEIRALKEAQIYSELKNIITKGQMNF